jgi:hypothetical protein
LVAQVALHDEALVSKNFRITARTQESEPTINQIHRWLIHVEDLDGNPVENASIQIVGGMPEHNHGLPTAPKVTMYLGQGNYLVEGMKFHMAGLWRIEFSVSANNQEDVLVLNLRL